MSSCELPGGPGAVGGRVTAAGSRVHRLVPGAAHSWTGVPPQEYKAAAAHHCGVTRSVLVGDAGEKTAFHVRYFEVAPGGFTTRERHAHEHVVFALRGVGVAVLGEAEHELRPGDTLYVAPGEVHQLRNPAADEPFGFLCVVDAVRDRPVAVEAAGH
ncbi:MAG: cupin domain-containing protein [Gemmataceae bacterium]